MSSQTATHAETRERIAIRVRVVAALGPLTVAAGIAWAIVQPWRITLLHPHAQGFWWLAVEPPLLVAAAGLAFHRFVARPLLEDLEDVD